MRRGLIALVLALVVVGGGAGVLAWALNPPRPPAGASQAERLYYVYCVECHGVDGRGSWRAWLFLLRPGDLTDVNATGASDQYLFDIIKHGGAPLGQPGMPAFGYHLTDEAIRGLVAYVRTLSERPRPSAAAEP
ncbi:MAG TPA: cytochrome c [Candidatus Tectomicrobia bacterium]|nr:cytochrome c [Candidatus Tectomicrobia bacterium]